MCTLRFCGASLSEAGGIGTEAGGCPDAWITRTFGLVEVTDSAEVEETFAGEILFLEGSGEFRDPTGAGEGVLKSG